MNSKHTNFSASCAVCRHLEHECQGRSLAEMNQPCSKFERYGEFLAKELAFVDRQFVLHQIAGLGLAVALGLGMTWAIRYIA